MQSTLLARKSFPLPVGIVSRHCGLPVRPGVVLVQNSAVSEIQPWMSHELFFPSRDSSLTFVLSAASKRNGPGPSCTSKGRKKETSPSILNFDEVKSGEISAPPHN